MKAHQMQPNATEGRAFDRVGISVFTSFAAGIHPKIMSERLGHASVAITLDLYSRVTPGLQTEAAEKLGAMILGEG